MQENKIRLKEIIWEIYLITNFKSQVTAWLDPQFSGISDGFTFLYVILHGNKWQRHFWLCFFSEKFCLWTNGKSTHRRLSRLFMYFTDQCRIISYHKSLRALCWFQKIPGIFTTDFRISIVILHASKKKVLGSHLSWNGLSPDSHY